MFQSRSMLSGLRYVLQALVGVEVVGSLMQRLVHGLALRLHTLSSGGGGGGGGWSPWGTVQSAYAYGFGIF
ncbi:unnamed protein product [Brassica rapa subsp. trilocularis]